MKKEQLYDLIERYIDNSLSDAERQEVERRIATDADFRAELELQRAMQQHLGDPSEVNLRLALDEVLSTPPANDSGPTDNTAAPRVLGRLLWAGLLALAVVAGVILWRPWNTGSNHDTLPPQQQPIQSPDPKTSPAPPAPAPAQDHNPQKEPIAMANPADFEPNSALEARIGNVRGDDGVELSLKITSSGEEFRSRKGQITLPVTGELRVDGAAPDQPIHLFIYSNRPNDYENKHALFDLPLSLDQTGEGQFRIEVRQTLRLRPGLYYAVAGQLRTSDAGGGYRTLWVGKFVVREGK